MSARAKSGRLVYALAQLSTRERRLLALLGAVFVPLAVVFLAILPQVQARDAARSAAAEAEAMLVWVSGQVRALPAEGTAPVAEPSRVDPIGISAIEQTLVQADLRGQVTDLSNRDDGGVNLAFEAVPFEALSDWLAATTPDWGYRIATFRIERTADAGLVRAAFELESGG